MGLLKSFKRMFSDAKGEKGSKADKAMNKLPSSKDAVTREGNLASAEEPMSMGLQPAMIDMMSSDTLTATESTSRAMQAGNNPYFESFDDNKGFPATFIKEDVKHTATLHDGTCSPRISAVSPAASVSRLPSRNASGALKATPPTTSPYGTQAAQPLPTRNGAASSALVPEGHTMVDRAKSHGPVSRRVSLKNLLQLQSYSFISDVDCSEAQQAVDSSDSEDETGYQYQSGEHLGLSSSDNVHRASRQLLSPQTTMSRELYRSASSRNRGYPALTTAHEGSNYRQSRMSRGGNAPTRMASMSAGYNVITSNASILSSINDQAIEEVLSPRQKEPKDSNVMAVGTALPRAMKRSVWSVGDYALSKQLHNGYASKVYSAECKASGLKVVLKVYRLEKMCDLQRCQLFREISIHSKVQHQNIVQFFCAFMEENCVIIVQEFAAGGDLLRYMYRMGGRLTERAAAKLVLQPFLCALHYLHTQGIIHRDIKPENCLLTGDMVLQIADFGLAVDLKEERANTRAGTLDYMAPEVLRCPTKQTPDQFKTVPGAAHYEMAADSWAVGAFAYELLCGRPPFRGGEMMETAHNIIRGDVYFPKDLSPGAVDFISSCLEPNPANRLTVIKMLNHPWIKMFERRKTVNNFQDGTSASQLDTSHVGYSYVRPPIAKAPGAGRLALIMGRNAQPAAVVSASPHEGQGLPLPILSPATVARTGRRSALGAY